MKVEIDGNYIDPETVDSVLQVKAETNSIEEGAFSFKPDTEIVLKNGRSFRTSRSTKEIHDLLYCRPGQQEHDKDNSTAPDDIGVADVVKLGEAFLKELHSLAENSHTISEMLTRLTLHITEGGVIRIKQEA